ncbi:MAG: KUP/HAK/KT family potassium transporter, partial [Burkholderiaceae bacterium]
LIVAVAATGLFLFVDMVLVVACSLKFFEGGWFPLALGLALFTVMASWRRGRELLMASISQGDPQLVPFLQALAAEAVPRAQRTAVYAVANAVTVPQALMHNLKHNQVLHERNLILTVLFQDVPLVPASERVRIEPLAPGFWRVEVNYGFKDTPDIPEALASCQSEELPIDLFETTYFLSRETIIPTRKPGMMLWREGLFAFMARNAGNIASFLRLPDNCVIELGTRVQI